MGLECGPRSGSQSGQRCPEGQSLHSHRHWDVRAAAGAVTTGVFQRLKTSHFQVPLLFLLHALNSMCELSLGVLGPKPATIDSSSPGTISQKELSSLTCL